MKNNWMDEMKDKFQKRLENMTPYEQIQWQKKIIREEAKDGNKTSINRPKR